MQPLSHLYDRHFQAAFVASMLRDGEFLQSVAADVRPETFTDEGLQRAVRLIQQFYQEHNGAPDTLVFNEMAKLEQAGTLPKEIHNTLKLTLDSLFAVELNNRRYLLDEFARFLRHRKVADTLPKFVAQVEAGDFETAEDLMREVFAFRPSRETDLGKEYTEDATERTLRRQRSEDDAFWSLIPELDQVIPGIRRGQLAVLQSQKSSFGKTAAMALLTRSYLVQGYKVLIFSLEETLQQYEDRLDQAIMGLRLDELVYKGGEIQERLGALRQHGGGVWLKELPGRTTKISDLRQITRMIENVHGFRPDAVMIDYCDVMAPETSALRSDSYATGKEIYQAFHDWVQEDRLVGWTAMQSSRGAHQATYAEQEHSSGSIAKVQIADVVISINRTAEEREAGITRLWVVKGRESAAQVEVRINTDFSRGLFWVPGNE